MRVLETDGMRLRARSLGYRWESLWSEGSRAQGLNVREMKKCLHHLDDGGSGLKEH